MSLPSSGCLFSLNSCRVSIKRYRTRASRTQTSSVMKCSIATQVYTSHLGRHPRRNLRRFAHKTFKHSRFRKVRINEILTLTKIFNQMTLSHPLSQKTKAKNCISFRAVAQRCYQRRQRRLHKCLQTFVASLKNSCRSKNDQV